MELSEKLVVLRKEKGLTQLKLAEALNVTRQAVSRWETGDAVPSMESLKCLSDLYGVPLDYLLKEDAERTGRMEAPPEKTGEKNRANKTRLWKWILAAVIALAFLASLLIFVRIIREQKDVYSMDELKVEVVETIPTEEFDLEW